MSGETHEQVSGWTVDTIKAHLERLLDERDARYEQRFLAQEKAVTQALSAADKATSKAEVAAEKRFEAVNEFRQTLSDQTATFIPRSEAEAAIGRNAQDITDLRAWRDNQAGTIAAQRNSSADGRAEAMRLIAMLSAVIAAVAVLLSVLR